MRERPVRILITCEHARNRVPAPYRKIFRGSRRILLSHLAFDIGAEELAADMERRSEFPNVFFRFPWTRLLIDANRSSSHPSLFSRQFTRRLPGKDRSALLKNLYLPFRDAARKQVEQWISEGKTVVHISVHSFTPVWKSVKRKADVGILYDPNRKAEAKLGRMWRKRIQKGRPGLKVRLNYPYRGVSDGHVTSLRREYRRCRYIGMELEVNRKLYFGKGTGWRDMKKLLSETFLHAVRASIASGGGTD